MRIAVFSDVHGNLTALEAVLTHIDQQAPDMIAFAGDLCLFGPRAAECLGLVRGRNIVTVYGNTDLWVINPPVPKDEEHAHQLHLQEMGEWTKAQLSDSDLSWLGTRPFGHRISPTPRAQDDLLIVHANPQDVDRFIAPTAEKQNELFGEVSQAQADEELASLLKGVSAGVVAYGHLHVPNVRQWDDLILANISSVSLPVDRDVRAKYGLLTWDGERGWSVQLQHVPYDIDAEIKALSGAQQPSWETYVQWLRRGER